MKMAKSFIKVLKTHTPDVTEYREAAHAMFFARTEKKVKVLIFNLMTSFQFCSCGISIP